LKDVLLVIVPAAFGLAGTFLGAYLTQRAAVNERRSKEDTAARQALVDLLHPIRRVSGSFAVDELGATTFVMPLPRDRSAIVDSVNVTEAALLTAGVPWTTFEWGLLHSRTLAESIAIGAGATDDSAARRQLVDAATEAVRGIEGFLELLDRSRRYRRSAGAAARMGVPGDTQHPLAGAGARPTPA
jgi:hypothetical protein